MIYFGSGSYFSVGFGSYFIILVCVGDSVEESGSGIIFFGSWSYFSVVLHPTFFALVCVGNGVVDTELIFFSDPE
jgi:hypothetical protein